MSITTHILSTTGVNNSTYQHAMLIKIVMLTRKYPLDQVQPISSEFSLLFALYLVGGAGITPFISLVYISLYLVEISLVNIMFWHYRLQYKSSALLYISNQLLCNVLFVTCYVLLSVISYIYNALGVTRKACIVTQEFDN